MVEGSAPGKLILTGEHAVVYGRPAIALPIAGMRAYAQVRGSESGSGVVIEAHELGRSWTLADEPNDPISKLVTSVLDHLAIASMPDLQIAISSAIPIASGMGSGAAVATAIVRGLVRYFERELPAEEISALVYESERHFHGTPSGIDNTVIAFEHPIWFKRSDRGAGARSQGSGVAEPIAIGAALTLLIGDSGVRSATRLPVGEVQRRWQSEPTRYEKLFDTIGALALQVRRALEQGDPPLLGTLLDRNHTLLQEIGVSSPELDKLVHAARAAGALGAKLSGAGWGGIMLALVGPTTHDKVARALSAAGATHVYDATTIATSQR